MLNTQNQIAKLKIIGLIGSKLGHSFSQSYFQKKFEQLNIDDWTYLNFELDSISEIEKLQADESVIGFNVTFPYKKEILPYLSTLSDTAKSAQAVNTVFIDADRQLHGFNTDVFGFLKSVKTWAGTSVENALILGTGGAAQAVRAALDNLEINSAFVSRDPHFDLMYHEIKREIVENAQLIINCTPLGTFPKSSEMPDFPIEFLNENHFVYDLVYNPEKSLFLTEAEKQGAQIKNGREMLELQAEKAWQIWTTLLAQSSLL